MSDKTTSEKAAREIVELVCISLALQGALSDDVSAVAMDGASEQFTAIIETHTHATAMREANEKCMAYFESKHDEDAPYNPHLEIDAITALRKALGQGGA